MIQTMLKRKVWLGDPYPLADLDRVVQIRCDTRTLLATFLASTLAVAKYQLA